MTKKVSEINKRGLNRLVQNVVEEKPESETLKDKLAVAGATGFPSIQSEDAKVTNVKASSGFDDGVVVPKTPDYNFDLFKMNGRDDASTFDGVPKSVDELVTGLKQISDTYNGVTDRDYYKDLLPEIRESLGLEKVDEVQIDKDKIEADIRASLEAENEAKKKELQRKASLDEQKLLDNEKKMALKTGESAREVYKYFDDAMEKADADSLKRGLARSSIAVFRIDGLEEARARELSSLANKLSDDLRENEQKIENLKSELNSALENLDIALAGEITQRVQKQIEAMQKKQKEAIDFNNSVDKLEAEYQIKRQSAVERNQELEKQFAKEYRGEALKSKEEDLFNLAEKYFAGLTKAEGIKQLTSNPELIELLGTRFNDLYYLLMTRK